jgi:lipopolysaccharide export LptBFGC system permease protein LptF
MLMVDKKKRKKGIIYLIIGLISITIGIYILIIAFTTYGGYGGFYIVMLLLPVGVGFFIDGLVKLFKSN